MIRVDDYNYTIVMSHANRNKLSIFISHGINNDKEM